MNFDLSGATKMSTINEFNRVTMDNGIAQLFDVVPHTSKKGNLNAKIIFRDVLDLTNEQAGHHEYISMSEANRLSKSLDKIRYAFEHSGNEQALNAFNALPNMIAPIKDDSGNPISFVKMEEFENISKKLNRTDLSWIWDNDDTKKVRYVVEWTVAPEQYIPQLINALSMLKGSNFFLELGTEDSFQRLQTILPPTLK